MLLQQRFRPEAYILLEEGARTLNKLTNLVNIFTLSIVFAASALIIGNC